MTVAKSTLTEHEASFAEWGFAVSPSSRPGLLPVTALVDLALRRNPKRAHLLVSRILAKHVPTEPGIAVAAGLLLGLQVRHALSPLSDTDSRIADAASRLEDLLAGNPIAEADRAVAIADLCRDLHVQPACPDVATIGYAETATGLGQLVADSLGSYYIHSTRHVAAGTDAVRPYAAFEESHSHATSHQLLPTRHSALSGTGTIVLVDDELSTGATVVNTITALHATAPHRQYIVASLIDLRPAEDRNRLDELAFKLDCRITVVSLANGDIAVPGDLPAKAASFVSRFANEPVPAPKCGHVSVLDLTRSVEPIRSARFGNSAGATVCSAADRVAEKMATVVPATGRLLILATEEFMALPLAIASALQQRLPGVSVRYSTSTRSPITVIDREGYPVRSAVTFNSHDATTDGPGRRYAYNFNHAGQRFDRVVILAEPGTQTAALTGPGCIAEAVSTTGASVQVVLLPAERPFPEFGQGPSFGSYAASEVRWLIKDLSFAELEAPTAVREAAIQSGRANYAESLPQEYVPSSEYEELYKAALSRSASRVAFAVGRVTEQVLAVRAGAPVLVSLARAGTPAGILMKRWATQVHGVDLPHYTASIVRGIGLDQTALSYLASHYAPEQIMFVDGWTGKGAIARELEAAVADFARTDGAQFSPELAVLADPGHCSEIFGTRDDFLIPSACLNSTVSGLVSRTVFNRDLIFPNDFHGAKYYRELAPRDVSEAFVNAVSERFADVQDNVITSTEANTAEAVGNRASDWSGWAAVERISKDFGINNTNLVKPGVGETTRVLLRRVPWKILVRSTSREDVQHVLLLARLRDVEVVYVDDLPYTCVGLIHPLPGTRSMPEIEQKSAVS
ncbi:phosphoribosyltransferase domain-containing protein [Arthrobacter sp. ISL-85]|uniref:phosphoribosyltransferase domain-containing protein n=1 Tax=Arthrobacter sp. ISL-85 TaxID=2819115 RepID=UPI001BE8C789|nr:phosphoribosyltransferase domain-containing protein [Arthrobacter sp. ISL-85]MBT2568667.1 phosphoribosyltransferase domain-containing protein [Arthrobacter sp. ISL-85]